MLDDLASYVHLNYFGDHIGNRNQDLSSYSQIDLGMSYQLNQSLGLRVGMTNAGDEQPVLNDPTSDMILQGRAVFVDANYRF